MTEAARVAKAIRRRVSRRRHRRNLREFVWVRDGGRCWLCRGKLNPAHWTLDHVIPVCAGGLTTRENCRPAHERCNVKRGHALIFARVPWLGPPPFRDQPGASR